MYLGVNVKKKKRCKSCASGVICGSAYIMWGSANTVSLQVELELCPCSVPKNMLSGEGDSRSASGPLEKVNISIFFYIF